MRIPPRIGRHGGWLKADDGAVLAAGRRSAAGVHAALQRWPPGQQYAETTMPTPSAT
jgi:hypothetical protein